MLSGRHLALAGALAAVALCATKPASATVMSSSASIASCTNSRGLTVNGCTDTIYYSDTVATDTTPFISGNIDNQNPINADFVTAFNDWNATVGGNTWTLVNGGTLNLNLTLSIGAGLSSNSGGITPVIVNISNYIQAPGGPSLGQLAWTQALFTNYTPTIGLTATPDITLDTYSLSAGASSSNGAFTKACTPIPGPPNADNNTTPSTIGAEPSGTAYCDPIYPFQYGTTVNGASTSGVTLGVDPFYDGPQGPWASGAFRGIALLSTVTYDTNSAGVITGDILTVYQGVDYGFSLSSTPGSGTTAVPAVVTTQLQNVPEPAAIGIVMVGVVAAMLARTRVPRRRA